MASSLKNAGSGRIGSGFGFASSGRIGLSSAEAGRVRPVHISIMCELLRFFLQILTVSLKKSQCLLQLFVIKKKYFYNYSTVNLKSPKNYNFFETFRLSSQSAGCGLVRASRKLFEPASLRVRARLDAIPNK